MCNRSGSGIVNQAKVVYRIKPASMSFDSEIIRIWVLTIFHCNLRVVFLRRAISPQFCTFACNVCSLKQCLQKTSETVFMGVDKRALLNILVASFHLK